MIARVRPAVCRSRHQRFVLWASASAQVLRYCIILICILSTFFFPAVLFFGSDVPLFDTPWKAFLRTFQYLIDGPSYDDVDTGRYA